MTCYSCKYLVRIYVKHNPDLRLSDSIKGDPISLAQKWLLLSEEEVKFHGVGSLFSPTVNVLIEAAANRAWSATPPPPPPNFPNTHKTMGQTTCRVKEPGPPRSPTKKGGCRLLHRTALNVEHWIQELFSICVTITRLGPVVSTTGEGERGKRRRNLCQCLVTSLSLRTINAKHRIK
jgi:hypothetical protein